MHITAEFHWRPDENDRRIVGLVYDEHCTISALSSIAFKADRFCDLRGLLGVSETSWRNRRSSGSPVLIACSNLVEGFLLGHHCLTGGEEGSPEWSGVACKMEERGIVR